MNISTTTFARIGLGAVFTLTAAAGAVAGMPERASAASSPAGLTLRVCDGRGQCTWPSSAQGSDGALLTIGWGGDDPQVSTQKDKILYVGYYTGGGQ
jgi:hypothetical protein